MEPFRDDNDLIAELRALRPEPSEEFAADLDGRAAAGFPRRSSPAGAPLTRLFARLRAVPPRRLALSVASAALATIVLATAIVAMGERGGDSSQLAQGGAVEHSASPARAPSHASTEGNSAYLPPASRASSGKGDSSGIQYEAAAPAAAGYLDSGSESAGGAGTVGTGSASAKNFDGSGPYAANADHREVERSAEMVLGADPADVSGDASAVFDAVHAANGVVLSSSVTGGAAGYAGARFELLIPAAKLGDALAAFSGIDAVVSRHEATDDITAPTVRIGEQLRDSRATIDGLLVQLAGADSAGERAEVEAELKSERRHSASLRARTAKLDRRANLSRVSLRIETDSAATSGESGGGWSIGDALHDAGHILAIAAGVTIVGLAILGPIALLVLLAWLANRTRLRRARERTLV
jgi:Domain of unknown function (DUF4349)